MAMLLEDLAEETSASNRRAADRLDAERRDLDNRRAGVALDELRLAAVDSARQATDYVLARVPQVECVWQAALAALRKAPTESDAAQVLHIVLGVLETSQRLVQAPQALWEIAVQLGAAPEPLDELMQAESCLDALRSEATQALDHRTRGWVPADPQRLTQGVQLARDGRAVSAHVARARFCRTPS